MKMLGMILFMLLPLLGLAYVGWHVWRLVPLSAAWRIGLIALGILSFLSSFLVFSRVVDRLPMSLARLIYDVGCSSIFVLLYLVIIFVVLDLGRLVHLLPARLLHQSVYTTIAITLGLFVIFLLGNINYHHKVRQELTLTTEKLLQRPLKMVMMSDLHLGYHNPQKELKRWVDLINSEKPDVVLMAGDLIDMSMRPLLEEHMADELKRVEAPIYACLGNHEYYSGEPAAQRFYQEAGIHLLRDTAVVVGDLCIIGRDDRSNRHRKALADIMATADTSKYTIVLDHQPHHLEEAEAAGVDFQLSGHTHNGQVWPVSWIEKTMYECAYGQHQRGNTRYYVSSGLGIWGGKFRIGTCSEYLICSLRAK